MIAICMFLVSVNDKFPRVLLNCGKPIYHQGLLRQTAK